MLFFCHQPCISFPLNAVKLSSFHRLSLHHFQQLHLHINELSHSYYNYFAEVVVLSPTCFLFLSINLSWLRKERLPRTQYESASAAAENLKKGRGIIRTHFTLVFKKETESIHLLHSSVFCSWLLSACPLKHVCSPLLWCPDRQTPGLVLSRASSPEYLS